MAKNVTLYDAKGRPIKARSLKEEQARASLTGVLNYHALAPAAAMSPYKLAAALRMGAQGDITAQADLFAEMEEKDSHIFAETDKRKRGVTGQPWTVQPGDDSPEAAEIAEFARSNLEALNQPKPLETFEAGGLFFDLLDATGKGFSATELLWDYSEGQWIIAKALHKPQQFFQFHTERPELRLINGEVNGEELRPMKWSVHLCRAKSGSPYSGALFRILAWLYLFRNYSAKAWAQFVESYGLPIRLGKYPVGSSEEEKDTLLAALAALATECAAIIPEGMSVEIIQQALKGDTPQHEFLKWSEKAISIAILGATLTTDTQGVGSQALGNVHNDIRLDILNADADALEMTVNAQIIRPLVSWNFGPQKNYPYYRIERPDTKDKAEILARIKGLVEMGWRDIPVWWVREQLGIPAPEDGDETLADVLAAALPARSTRPEANALTLALNRAAPAAKGGQADIDAMQAALAGTLGKLSEDMLGPVLEALHGCASYEEALARIDAGFPELDTTAAVGPLARAAFAADLRGRKAADEDGR